MVERCALSGSDLKIKFRTVLLTSMYVCMYVCMYVLLRKPFTTLFQASWLSFEALHHS